MKNLTNLTDLIEQLVTPVSDVDSEIQARLQSYGPNAGDFYSQRRTLRKLLANSLTQDMDRQDTATTFSSAFAQAYPLLAANYIGHVQALDPSREVNKVFYLDAVRLQSEGITVDGPVPMQLRFSSASVNPTEKRLRLKYPVPPASLDMMVEIMHAIAHEIALDLNHGLLSHMLQDAPVQESTHPHPGQ